MKKLLLISIIALSSALCHGMFPEGRRPDEALYRSGDRPYGTNMQRDLNFVARQEAMAEQRREEQFKCPAHFQRPGLQPINGPIIGKTPVRYR